MKTTMKKVLSMALALLLVVGMLPMAAQAAHTHYDDNNNGTCDEAGCQFDMDGCDGGHDFATNDCTVDKVCQRTDCGYTEAAKLHPNGTMKTNDGYHWYECNVCHEMYSAASHSGGTATCSAKAVCTTCNTAYGELGTAHTGGTASCKAQAVCTACNTPYGEWNGTNHLRTEVRYASAATCGTAGHTGDTYCLDCGAVTYGTAIPATGNHTWAAADCESPKTCTVCGETDGPDPSHTWINANCTTPKTCSVCGKTEGAAQGHDWEPANCTTPKTCKRTNCRVTEGGALGHSWDGTTCRICGVASSTVTRYTVSYNLNVNSSSTRPLGDYEANTPMTTVLSHLALKDLQHPSYFSSWYSLEGWYLDPYYNTKAAGNITDDCTLYAKWVRNYEYNVYLKIYTNGNSSNLVRIEDMFDYAQDHVITHDEVSSVVKKHIKSNNNAPLSIYGPFMPEDWDIYLRNNHKLNVQEKITVHNDRDTTIYVMVHNAKIGGSSSSSNSGSVADPSNPKTGDMIFMPVAVLGLSASALAVMFYLNKKRAF